MQAGKFTLLLTAFLLVTGLADAKIWRVNNLSNYNGTTQWGSNLGGSQPFPVFKEINQAVGSSLVLAGDTLYVEGSQARYAGANINKRLTLIGEGYLLNENPKTSTLMHPTQLAGISFNAGSDGSQLIGFWVDDGISVDASNITLKRSYLESRIDLRPGIANIHILQNYFIGATNTSAVTKNGVGASPTDVVFSNNICRRPLDVTGFTFLEVRNNVFDPPPPTPSIYSIRIHTNSFQNNILKSPSATVDINSGTNLNVAYNTAGSPSQFGTANNNIVVDLTALFVDPATNSTDGDYQLKPGSAAGSDGAERGAFGGAVPQNRYVLSGLAAIPVIYELQTSGVATQTGMPVNLKARTIQ